MKHSEKIGKESLEQACLVAQLRAAGIGFFSVPNEGHHTAAAHCHFGRTGRTPGAPDLVLVDRAPEDGRPVALEMKGKGGRLSLKQKAFHVKLRAAGWHVIVAWGFREAGEKLRGLGYVI